MLDERKAAILRAVVEEYIATAQPVGSGHVARSRSVNVSSATVRNDMAALEKDGFLRQPHTSAGRVPTDKGYRFFVDQLRAPGRLEVTKAEQVRSFFARAHGELEEMLRDTSRLLSNLTDYAAVVVGPPHEAASIRSVQLVSLSSRVVLVLVVLSNGAVEKHTLELNDDIGEERVAAATAHLSRHLLGTTLAEPAAVPATGDPGVDVLCAAACRASAPAGDRESDNIFVGGVSRMASAFDAVETVRQVLATLEQQYVVVSLLRDLLDRGLHVAIGAEHGLEPLSECSVVVAPYEVEGESAGTIAVLGPTRMNYPEALAAVAVVSRRLGRMLTEG
jgi:heat-inducible transcriptional repressor